MVAHYMLLYRVLCSLGFYYSFLSFLGPGSSSAMVYEAIKGHFRLGWIVLSRNTQRTLPTSLSLPFQTPGRKDPHGSPGIWDVLFNAVRYNQGAGSCGPLPAQQGGGR